MIRRTNLIENQGKWYTLETELQQIQIMELSAQTFKMTVLKIYKEIKKKI